jgi:putative membrane protein
MLNRTDSGPESLGHRVTSLVLRWLALAIGVWVAARLVPGIDAVDFPSLLVAALVLGVLNSLVKPILVALALPFVVFTFGIFLLFINAFLLLLTSKLVPGFRVEGFWPAMGASLIISVLSMVLGIPPNFRRRRRVVMTSEARFGDRTPPPGKGPIIDV